MSLHARSFISINIILSVEDCLFMYCIWSGNMASRIAETLVRSDRRNSLALFYWLKSSKDKTGSTFKIRKRLQTVKLQQKQTHDVLDIRYSRIRITGF